MTGGRPYTLPHNDRPRGNLQQIDTIIFLYFLTSKRFFFIIIIMKNYILYKIIGIQNRDDIDIQIFRIIIFFIVVLYVVLFPINLIKEYTSADYYNYLIFYATMPLFMVFFYFLVFIINILYYLHLFYL